MLSSPEIVAFLEDRIGHIYARPLMYGGTAEGVYLILHYYHELWAVLHERRDEFEHERIELHARESCQSANFAFHYGREKPEASALEIAQYVVEQWRKLDALLKIPIPHHSVPSSSPFPEP